MKKRTLKALYYRAKKRPTPAASFIKSVAQLTNRSETAVRKWISGESQPDMNVMITLSQHFGVPYDELFPEND